MSLRQISNEIVATAARTAWMYRMTPMKMTTPGRRVGTWDESFQDRSFRDTVVTGPTRIGGYRPGSPGRLPSTIPVPAAVARGVLIDIRRRVWAPCSGPSGSGCRCCSAGSPFIARLRHGTPAGDGFRRRRLCRMPSIRCAYPGVVLERTTGIEPASSAWKAEVLAVELRPQEPTPYRRRVADVS